MENFYNKEYLDYKTKKNFLINDIIHFFCHTNEDSLFVDYRFFKLINNIDLFQNYYNILVHNIDKLLQKNNNIFIHVNIEKFSLTDFDKYSNIFTKLTNLFIEKYPDILNKLFIYGSGIIYEKLIKMLSMFLTKETRTKMILIDN
jgi:hypothetical protein